MGRNYWMVVTSAEDFEVTKNLGFGVFGVKTKYRRRAQRMQPDDRMLFYVSTLRKWTAIVTITSQYYEDRQPIWTPLKRGETYPYRVKTQPLTVLNEEDYIDALILAPRLEYVKRWAPEDWPLAFFDSLHLLPQKDYRLIEGEMDRIIFSRTGKRPVRDNDGERFESAQSRPPRNRRDMARRIWRPSPERQSATEDSSIGSE